MSLGVLESTASVVRRSRRVRIDDGAIARLAADLATAPAPVWDRRYHLDAGRQEVVQYLFIVDTLNFCFWGEPKWRIHYEGEALDGYWALVASLRRAVEEGVPLLDAAFLASIDDIAVAAIFRGDSEIPLLPERGRLLRETGAVLLAQFGGQAVNVLDRYVDDAVEFVLGVVQHFPSFNDVDRYADQEVRFFKRAQILAADLWSALPAAERPRWGGLSGLTAFADYKIPQILRAKGVLSYAPELADRVDRLVEIPAGSTAEVEIRAATVQAVNRLSGAVATLGVARTAAELDGMLWHASQDPAGMKPYHRTRTIFY